MTYSRRTLSIPLITHKSPKRKVQSRLRWEYNFGCNERLISSPAISKSKKALPAEFDLSAIWYFECWLGVPLYCQGRDEEEDQSDPFAWHPIARNCYHVYGILFRLNGNVGSYIHNKKGNDYPLTIEVDLYEWFGPHSTSKPQMSFPKDNNLE